MVAKMNDDSGLNSKGATKNNNSNASYVKHVDHTYRDFSRYIENGGKLIKHKKSEANFPAKLHKMLSEPANSHVITWMPHGRAWKILNKDVLFSSVLPNYYVCKKYESFTRQLNGWGFKRLHQSGPDLGCYYHECFLQGMPKLTCLIRRLPPNLGKASPHPAGEPNFYRISEVYPLPSRSSSPDSKIDPKYEPVKQESASEGAEATSSQNAPAHEQSRERSQCDESRNPSLSETRPSPPQETLEGFRFESPAPAAGTHSLSNEPMAELQEAMAVPVATSIATTTATATPEIHLQAAPSNVSQPSEITYQPPPPLPPTRSRSEEYSVGFAAGLEYARTMMSGERSPRFALPPPPPPPRGPPHAPYPPHGYPPSPRAMEMDYTPRPPDPQYGDHYGRPSPRIQPPQFRRIRSHQPPGSTYHHSPPMRGAAPIDEHSAYANYGRTHALNTAQPVPLMPPPSGPARPTLTPHDRGRSCPERFVALDNGPPRNASPTMEPIPFQTEMGSEDMGELRLEGAVPPVVHKMDPPRM